VINLLDNSQGLVTNALRQWESRKVMPTALSSAELRGLGREVRERAVFSARCTNAEFLNRLQEVVDDLLSGKINMATARWELMKQLKVLGYDPAVGFPDDQLEAGDNVPPAEAGSLRDLGSEQRLNLMLETNRRMAANYGRMIEGNKPWARQAYPAWELVRIFPRKIMRGTMQSESPGWEERWSDAGTAVNWEGALEDPMMARKDSPIWMALGAGTGGYDDALDNPYPPYAFNSGMGWREVKRAEWEELSPQDAGTVPEPMEAQLTPGQKEVVAAFDRLSPKLQEELRKEMAGILARRK